MRIDDLIIGKIYKSEEYAKAFKCSYMSGMNYSKETNTLVLISKQNNGCYRDKWDFETNILHYTGQGTIGDQELHKGSNKRLLEAKQNKTKVYLFEVFKEAENIYQGEVELVGEPYQVFEEDINKNIRKVWKFPIRKIDLSKPAPIDEKQIIKVEKKLEKDISKEDEKLIKAKALKVDGKVDTRPVVSMHRSRNQYVSKYVKNRAKGICDLCGKPAPFNNKDNTPYLESHHVITLSNNGPDVIYNTVALCPNCHRKVHVLEDPKDIKKLSNILFKYLLDDGEEETIKKFTDLFKVDNE